MLRPSHGVATAPHVVAPAPHGVATAQRGAAPRSRRLPVVRRFLGDGDVVRMALAHTGGADTHEAGVALELLDGGDTAVAHAGAQAADQLEHHVAQRALVRHAAFDALGHQLRARFAGLEVAVAAALIHGADRAHAAVLLVGAAFPQDRFARALFGTGEQAADHDAVGAGGDRLGDVARVADAAVGNDRHARIGGRA